MPQISSGFLTKTMNNLLSAHNSSSSSSSSYSWSINISSESFPCTWNRGRVVMNAGRSLYDLLELHPQVGISEIKRSYRRIALKTHPDVFPSHVRKEDSTTRFIEIQEAYETLSDPRRRAIYDHGRLSSSSSSTSRSSWNKVKFPKHTVKLYDHSFILSSICLSFCYFLTPLQIKHIVMSYNVGSYHAML